MLCGTALMLLVDVVYCVAQRCARNFNQSTEWPVQLHYQEDRTRDRQRTQEQGCDYGRVVGREKSEAQKNYGHPEDQQHKERHRNRAATLLEEQQARLPNVDAHLDGLRLERALNVVLRFEFLDLVEEQFAPRCGRAQLRICDRVIRPNPVDHSSDGELEQIASFL